jgi:S1-C subfamily serine protease
MARRDRSRPRKPERAGISGAALAGIVGGAVVGVGLIVVLVVSLLRGGAEPEVAEAEPPPRAVQPQPRPAVPAVIPAQPVATVPPANALPAAIAADGALAFQTLDTLKRASVFVRVEAGKELATGSGFLARVDGNTGFVVTNHHVIAPPRERVIIMQRPPQRIPGSRLQTPGRTTILVQPGGLVNPVYSLVFNSGTPEEKTYPAQVVADDAQNDLAILRIQDPPAGATPIAMDLQTGLMETMPVFVLGFPFGEMLSSTNGNPAITVGKGSVSSIRRDKAGQIEWVQIHGDLNPGNSGGAVVDAQGRLVGIAQATLKGTQIGKLIPAARLPTLLASAPVQGILAAAPPPAAPMNPPAQAAPNQASPPPQNNSPLVVDNTPPVNGWKEYTPKDMSFAVSLPDRGGRKFERERTLNLRGSRLKITLVLLELPEGLTLNAGALVLPAQFRQIPAPQRIEMFRDSFLSEFRGRITAERDVKQAGLQGREYEVTAAGVAMARLRLFASGSYVYQAAVQGLPEQVQSADATAFLNSFNVPPAELRAKAQKAQAAAAGKQTGRVALKYPADVFPFIQSAIHQERVTPVDIKGFTLGNAPYRDCPEAGGILIGFQVGLGKFIERPIVNAVRPIYITKKGEEMGSWYGPVPDEPITVKAKDGYVVGGLFLRSGLGLDGFSVKFFKREGGKILSKENYESEWVGGQGGHNLHTIGGQGCLFIGICGHLSNQQVPTSLGLLTVTN